MESGVAVMARVLLWRFEKHFSSLLPQDGSMVDFFAKADVDGMKWVRCSLYIKLLGIKGLTLSEL